MYDITGEWPLQRRIALVAHDSKKRELLEWARFNRDLLAEHELFATGTTGRLLEKELDLEVECFQSGPLRRLYHLDGAVERGQRHRLERARLQADHVRAQLLQPVRDGLAEGARLGDEIRHHRVGRQADRHDDQRVHRQHAAAAGERPATQAVDERLDGRGQQDREHQQEQDLLDAPQQIGRQPDADQDQRRAGNLSRRELDGEDHGAHSIARVMPFSGRARRQAA